MKIVYLAAGAGAMYCGSCLHGNTLAAALCAAGHDCLLAPLYTPLHTDEENVGIRRVAFGGINVSLQQPGPCFVIRRGRSIGSWMGRGCSAGSRAAASSACVPNILAG